MADTRLETLNLGEALPAIEGGGGEKYPQISTRGLTPAASDCRCYTLNPQP